MNIEIRCEIARLQELGLLDPLLADKTTGRPILWATDAYAELGEGYAREQGIEAALITGEHAGLITNRAGKALSQQSERTRRHAEVFTPLWICAKMNDYADEMWFGRPNVFFVNDEPAEKLAFPADRSWREYVDSPRLELTCGEAPFLVSRYDAVSGSAIPVERRVGILDRKLRAVSENTKRKGDWLCWARRAYRATYGYEFQGDNLLIARLNLLMSFEEHFRARWKCEPTREEREAIIEIIAWNLWQMDGLTGTIPYSEPMEQLSMFDAPPPKTNKKETRENRRCIISNWREKKKNREILFANLSMGGRDEMKFDFIIGNPPYQEETESDSTRMPPIYHRFMEESYKLAKGVELITPARFLFNAGYTPRVWNEKMLNDKHYSVLFYEPDSSKVFTNTDIKGGVCISYHDEDKEYEPIVTFTKYEELNRILKKVKSITSDYIDSIISSPLNFQMTDLAKKENPDLVDRLRSSAFSNLASIFFEKKPDDGHHYICMIGLLNGRRVRRFIRSDYVRENANTLDKYALLLSKANGAGHFGEVLAEPEIAEPGVGYTQTFIAFGSFETKQEAENVKIYIHTKFARTMLGVLKITQDCPGPKWAYVPLQDFTPASDIDWSKSIPEIDRQLYAKYGLDEAEIAFIESHVKEMN